MREQEESVQAATDPAAGNGPAGGASGGKVLDRSVLAALRELQDEGEPDVLGELIELFLADAPPRFVICEKPQRPMTPGPSWRSRTP